MMVFLLLLLAFDEPSLNESAKPYFPIGVGLSDRIAKKPAEWPLMNRHFAYLTPENCMKPAAIAPNPTTRNFTLPDEFVAFAQKQNLKVVGHCLVWAKDDRTPAWFYKDGDKVLDKEALLKRMREYIHAVAGRYRGKIAMWDVVNESLDDGKEQYRPSGWTRATGSEYLSAAFRAAKEADPQALLIYNDYNNEKPGKREKMLKMLDQLLADKVPIDAVGLQGHYEIDDVPFADIEATINELKKRNLKIVVSELDIDVVPRGKWWAEDGKHRAELAKFNPYDPTCPPDVLQRQAEQYAKLFAIFRKHHSSILRVSFWNLHDGESWLNYFPWKRTNHPLLFDRDRKPKPAFHEVIKTLK